MRNTPPAPSVPEYERAKQQDPVTDEIVTEINGGSPYIEESDPLVEGLLALEREHEFTRETEPSSSGRPEESSESPKREEEELQATKQENAELRQQIKQQFQELSVLEGMMDGLETQVYSHEAVIKQQGLRIREQEETILLLTTRVQQFVQAMLLNAYKTRP